MKILSIMTIDPSVASEPSSQEEMDRMGKLIAEMKSKGVLIDTGRRMPGYARTNRRAQERQHHNYRRAVH
ncbi:MAG: hypothetical protein ACXWNZ_04720 [Vulcanimicrobiaceae bacterium]